MIPNLSTPGKKGLSFSYNHSTRRLIQRGCECKVVPKPPPVVIGVGSGQNTLLYSLDDGLTWTGLQKTIFSYEGRCAVWNGSIWVAGGTNDPSTGNVVAYSSDGISWTGIPTISFGPSNTLNFCTSMVWTGTNFVGVGADVIIRSPNGINWIGLNNVTSGQQLDKLATNGSRIVATPKSPSLVMMYSDDQGDSWTGITSADLAVSGILEFTDILWDGTKFIVGVGNRSNPIYSKFYSYTGASGTWIGIPNVAFQNTHNIGFKSPGLYIARGDTPNATERSSDGITWTTISDPVLDVFPFNQNGKGTIFSTEKYMFISGLTTVDNFIYSQDGLSWTLSSTNLPNSKLYAGFSTKPLPS